MEVSPDPIKTFILSSLLTPLSCAILLQEASYYFKRKTYLPFAFVVSCLLTYKSIGDSNSLPASQAQQWIFWTLLLIGGISSLIIYILDSQKIEIDFIKLNNADYDEQYSHKDYVYYAYVRCLYVCIRSRFQLGKPSSY